MSAKGAVFLDRDGVINRLIYHREVGIVDSPFTLRQFELLPKVPRAIRLLNGLDLPVVVVSNQPGIAKKHFDEATLCKFDRKLKSTLAAAGAHVDAIYYCLHHPEAMVKSLRKRCSCRKPGIGMLTQAARDLGITLADSYMVGDGLTDIEAGTRAGCRTVFVGRWKCENCQFIEPHCLRPCLVAKNLFEAARLIVSEVSAQSSGTRRVASNGRRGAPGGLTKYLPRNPGHVSTPERTGLL